MAALLTNLDPDHKLMVSPNDVLKALWNVVENHPIYFGIIPEPLLEDLSVKLLREIFRADFSRPKN